MSKFSIGLDIGTNSVGWAVVDENNQLVKKNGFTLWGVRMFEESKDASETRTFRTNRRRLARRKYRVELLRKIFKAEIDKVDTTFFQRLDDSFYKINDKKYANHHNLFNDSYTDKQFFDDFPTIYHLREHLCNSNKKEDIRFIYLALHHMIKYRGNFLYQGDSFNQSNVTRIKEIFEEFNILSIELSNVLEDYMDYFKPIEITDKLLNDLSELLISSKTVRDKKLYLKKLFNVDNKTLINECLIPLIVGSKCDFSTLYPVKHLKYEKCQLQLSAEDLENSIEENKSKIPELTTLIEFVINLKEVVDYYFLIKLLQNSNSLSEAMINQYVDHHIDLQELKKLIKTYLPNRYDECFRKCDKTINNYPHYVGMNSSHSIMNRFEHCSRDSFYVYINSLLNQIKDEKCIKIIEKFQRKIGNNEFLLRQNSDQNGSLPMQLNLVEMKKILEKQSKFYPFLLEKDDEGRTVSEKIISIFKFTIPYYIGPLNRKSNRSWIVRSDDKIYPWNFNSVVDVDESAKKFIQNMQRKCTYLKGKEDYCLPKKSIVFSKYNCLSYLNKISINGSLINPTVKMDIFNNVFLKNKKPTKKDIINYLISNYGDLNVSTSKLKDLPEVNCDMSSYVKFKEIFNKTFEENIDVIEQIIKDIVIFSDKKVLETRLKRVYKLDNSLIRQIKDLNYKDYSNLSNKLLTEIVFENKNTGEMVTVIDVMEKTNYTLPEILYASEYRLIDYINDYNESLFEGVEYESVEDFLNENIPVTPVMKRPLIQAHTIIKEISNILNVKIEDFNYYVECTRTNQNEKKQTKSRYEKLKELYAECKKLSFGANVDLDKLNNELEMNSENLKSDLLYLYFTQLGKCMYSLQDINLNDLMFNNNKWDIDHIYPQALIKDDSFNNKVLVLKGKNNEKQDNLLFEMPNFLNENCFAFYEKLKNMSLITKEKYRRLTKKELTQGELESFVNRQIVSTNQAVKGLIQTLKLYDKVDPQKIIYSKAENISLARKLFDLPKSRLANNYHHAHDAYLNVVVGRIINNYFVKNHFTGLNDYYRLKSEKKTINIENILKYNKWQYGNLAYMKEDVIALLNKNLYNRFDVSETTRTAYSNELFSKVTIKPASEGTVPIKQTGPLSRIQDYGGITSYSFCKYIIIEITNKKGIKECVLEAIPKAFDGKEDIYLKQIGYNDYVIKNYNIKTNVVIKKNSLKYCITGKTNQSYLLKNLHDRYFSKNFIKTIKKIEKYNLNLSNDCQMAYYNDYVVVAPAREQKCSEIILERNELIQLVEEIKKKYNSPVYEYSVIKTIYNNLNIISISKFSMKDLIKIINELLKLLQTNSRKSADLKLLNLSSNSGILTISKKLSLGMTFISESITGYYTKVLYEVK